LALLVGPLLWMRVVVPVVSHFGAVLGLLIILLAAFVSEGCKAVRYLIQKFWTWSIPGAFQLASFLVVARFPQKVVISSFDGGLEIVVDFLLGVHNVV